MKLFLLCLYLFFVPFIVFSQEKDTLTNNPQTSIYKKVSPYIVPSIFVAYGLSSLHINSIRDLDYRYRDHIIATNPNFSTKIDDYTQYLPAVAAIGLELMNVKGKNTCKDKSLIFALSFVLFSSTVRIEKSLHARLRPDSSQFTSFPSGHTATAFASAELLHQEYKDTHPWIGYLGYAVATGTGVMRMYNNRHWLSDVVMGAGIGIFSTKLAYAVYPSIRKIFYCKKDKNNFSFSPSYQNGVYGFSLSRRL